MANDPPRKLAAIVSADVVGYTRIMEADEAGTHARLKTRYADVVEPKILEYGGRVVKLMGDGLLAEFSSVLLAVDWAVSVQSRLYEFDFRDSEDAKIKYRIGVNLGDVIVDGDDIFGDGVNLAARLQEMAPPGGICIGEKVHSEISGKIKTVFIDGGKQSAKNIAVPINVWFWSPKNEGRSRETSSQETTLSLPELPSIAVLPFDNMSGDPEQEYFVDGLVEDILTNLSKVPRLFVIARNSSFKYKGKELDVRDVGEELGVLYVVEGSVRKAGSRVRVTAQLVKTTDGTHIWAERYDGELNDVFELQDRITHEIVTALEVKLTEGEQSSLWRERAGSPLVYEKYIKGRELYTNFSRQTHTQARRLLEEALEINPAYTPALCALGYLRVDQARFGWDSDRDKGYLAALEIAERALGLDPDYGEIYTVIGYANIFQRRFDDAVSAAEKAVSLSPNSVDAFHMSSMPHIYAGNFRIGRDYLRQAIRLSPIANENSLTELARAQFHLGVFEDSRKLAARVIKNEPRWLTAQTILLAALWELGRQEEAIQIVSSIKEISPNFSVKRWSDLWPYQYDNDLESLINPLRLAGLTK